MVTSDEAQLSNVHSNKAHRSEIPRRDAVHGEVPSSDVLSSQAHSRGTPTREEVQSIKAHGSKSSSTGHSPEPSSSRVLKGEAHSGACHSNKVQVQSCEVHEEHSTN